MSNFLDIFVALLGSSGLIGWYQVVASRRQAEKQAQQAEEQSRELRKARADETFSMAANHLASDRVSSHIGALTSLEHLAQAEPRLRQDVVNLLCGYLRDSPQGSGPDQVRNPQVARADCQRILATHLRPTDSELSGNAHAGEGSPFWPDIDLRLMGAALHDLDMSGCHIRSAWFNEAIFTGQTQFHDTVFYGPVDFENAGFRHKVEFMGCHFLDDAWFSGAHFHDEANFASTILGRRPMPPTVFHGDGWFRGAKFDKIALFTSTVFSDESIAAFDGADFAQAAWFGGASLPLGTFNSARFTGDANFDGVKFRELWFGDTMFCGDMTFQGVTSGEKVYLHHARLQRTNQQSPRYELPPGWAIQWMQSLGTYVFTSRWPGDSDRICFMINRPPRP
jgi:uncharacterized protein YjbI with pentapeptide repeats